MNTTDLLEVIKDVAAPPSGQQRFTDSKILSRCDNELLSGLLPLMRKQREDYFTFDQDITLVDGKFTYQIPGRAQGSALREVAFITSEGRVQSVPFLDIDTIGKNCGLTGFYIKNNLVHIHYPQIDTTKKLRLTYFIRPNKLVLPEECGTIISVSVSDGQTTVELDNVTSKMETGKLDVIRCDGGYEHLAIDQQPNVSGTTLIFDSEIEHIKVGDYVAVAGQTPVPQIPEELHPVLAQRAACKILESLGDVQALQAAKLVLAELEEGIQTLLTPRVEGEAKVLRNPSNPLRFS